jgi:hypothetical protein
MAKVDTSAPRSRVPARSPGLLAGNPPSAVGVPRSDDRVDRKVRSASADSGDRSPSIVRHSCRLISMI